MAEYIERSAAIEAAKHAWAKGLEPSQYIEILPAADVAPVVHGRWDVVEGRIENAICSKCGRHFQSYYEEYSYCPHCGAKMDGGADHAAD